MNPTVANETKSSPWGKMRQVETVNFEDIMSEQLANDLQLKEEKLVQSVTADSESCEFEVENSPEENDFLIAQMLQANDFQLKEEKPVQSVTAESESCDFEVENSPEENDFLIAQMLQAQFDKESDELVKKTEQKFNGTSKVCVSYVNYRVHPDKMLNDSDSDEDDVDDKHREWDSFVTSEKAFKAMPKCGYRKDGDNMVTKHDMEIAGRRNACRVMGFPPEFQTGDGGAFDMQLSNKVYNSLKVYSRHEQSRRNRLHDKSEQATAEMSVDPRTRLLLYKLVNQELLDRVNGILSTGKEAVVLHADGGTSADCVVPKECAIKIFKTTLNEFKTRDKYIQDDFRFKDRFSKQNPRKIIHMWAEKEMHNLVRMRKVGILCPEVVVLKKHVLVMSFIGQDHRPAEKLKDVVFKTSDLNEAYTQTTDMMKRLYVDAQLVHADLSEYNILWHDKKCWFIDVSQAVERNHPKALEFLLRDCTNVCNFFRRRGHRETKSPSELFKDITDIILPEDGASMLCRIQDYERNNELLTHQVTDKEYPFDHCWEQSKIAQTID